jgi:hypothetical protein
MDSWHPVLQITACIQPNIIRCECRPPRGGSCLRSQGTRSLISVIISPGHLDDILRSAPRTAWKTDGLVVLVELATAQGLDILVQATPLAPLELSFPALLAKPTSLHSISWPRVAAPTPSPTLWCPMRRCGARCVGVKRSGCLFWPSIWDLGLPFDWIH